MKSEGSRARFHYSKSDLVVGLRKAGIEEGDIIFSHVGLGELGFPKEIMEGKSPFDVVFEAVQEVIGLRGTWITPAFTYSFCKGEVFDPLTTPPTVGPFSQLFWDHPLSVRNNDPIFSVAAIGPKAEELFSDLPHDCYGADSVFDRIAKSGGKLCNIWDKIDNSYFHTLEQEFQAPYRYLKPFTGLVKKDDKLVEETWTYYARILQDTSITPGERLEKDSLASGIARCVSVGLGKIWSTRFMDLHALYQEKVKEDPWYLAQCPVFNPMEVERSEVLWTPPPVLTL